MATWARCIFDLVRRPRLSFVINVRGVGTQTGGGECFDFRVTLASQINQRDCERVGLGYRDPASVRAEDYRTPGRLWIEEGGQWLYARR